MGLGYGIVALKKLRKLLNQMRRNERKILMNDEILKQLLDTQNQILSEIKELKQNQVETNTRLDNLEQGQTKLEQGQTKLESEVSRIKESVIVIENDHGKKLGALLDGHAVLTDKLAPLPDAVETLQKDVSIIKIAVASHSEDISIFKNAI